MKHIGDLKITADNLNKYTELVEVSGTLYINVDASLPVLTTVGGALDIRADASLPALTTVGGTLYINTGKALDASILQVLHAIKGKLLAVSQYGLWLSDDGYYFAGCRGPLNKRAAIAHWNRTDDRAVMFTAAIQGASA